MAKDKPQIGGNSNDHPPQKPLATRTKSEAAAGSKQPPKKRRRNAFTFRRLMHMRLSAISVCLSQEAIGLQLLKEVIAFVVHKDKGREVFYFNLPNRFHS